MSQAPTLVSLHVSPWSERARWALDHHGLAYDLVQHAPFLGERRLRKLVGRTAPRVTVPLLLLPDRVLTESWDIAAWADAEGHGTRLVPPEHEAEIREIAQLVDGASHHGRALVMGAMLGSAGALDESVPPFVPGFIRVLMRPFTRYGTRWFIRKYALRVDAVEEHEAAVRDVLATLRRRIAGRRHIFDAFSYADIVAASLLQGIAPVADAHLRLGPATRATWTHPRLATEFADLVQWRDDLYARDRPKRVRT